MLSLNEFTKNFNEAVCRMENGYVIVMMTDSFDIQTIENETFSREAMYQKALEIRMFNKEMEIKWFRCSVDKELQCREIVDKDDLDSSSWTKYWDEYQYLDIDEKKTQAMNNGNKVYATGGGSYPLPLANYKNAKVKVRNYLTYEEDTNQLYICDWRLVDFQ